MYACVNISRVEAPSSIEESISCARRSCQKESFGSPSFRITGHVFFYRRGEAKDLGGVFIRNGRQIGRNKGAFKHTESDTVGLSLGCSAKTLGAGWC